MPRGILALLSVLAVACSAFAPGPSPTPTVTEFVIPTPSPKPSVVPTPFTGHYGFLVAGPNGYGVRAEGSETPLGTIDLTGIAVSPDGRFVAGFTRTGAVELQIRDVSSPAAVVRHVPLGAGERGLYAAWSVDESRVLFSVASGGTADAPTWSAVRTLDVTSATSTPAEPLRLDGVALRPALFDPVAGDLLGAFVTSGDAAREYVVKRGTDTPERTTEPDKPWQAAVTGDARYVALAAANEPTLRIFPSDQPSFILESHGSVDGGISVAGRPSSGEIGVIFDRQLVLWEPQTNLRHRVPTVTDLDAIVGFRFDGTAAIVHGANGLALLDVTNFVVTPLSGDVRFGVRLP